MAELVAAKQARAQRTDQKRCALLLSTSFPDFP